MISELLKSETSRYHDLAEEQFQSKKIFEGNFEKEDYEKLLLANFRLYATLESMVFKVLTPEFGEKLELENRRKFNLLKKDLDSLNLKLPNYKHFEEAISKSKAIGILYVMEGSTLGGNVMARHLKKNELLGDLDFNFMTIYGSELGEMWKKFKNVLDSDFNEHQYPEILNGADLAYKTLLMA